MKIKKLGCCWVRAIVIAVYAGSFCLNNAMAQNTRTTEIGYTTTLYGNGTPGNTNGPSAANVKFNAPLGITFDKDGNIYIAEDGAKGIRKITSTGEASLLAGSDSGQKGLENGEGTAARFITPLDVASDPQTGDIYVTDGNRIRKVTAAGVVSTFAGAGNNAAGFADGTPSEARFNYLAGIAIDKDGNIYLADRGNNRIRKYTKSTGQFTTLAGSSAGFADGTGTQAQFKMPSQLAVDDKGNVYVTDRGNFRIRKVEPNGKVTTLAGNAKAASVDGFWTDAGFADPFGIAVGKDGNIYVGEYNGRKIRQINKKGHVSTIAGTGEIGLVDGTGATAKFNQIAGIAIGANDNLYVVERRATVRMVVLGEDSKSRKKKK